VRYPKPLLSGTYLRRYQRFLVDVRLDDGTEVTAHCPNTGSMIGINVPGAACLVLPSDNPNRRLKYTLEAIRIGRAWVGAHPARANTVGREAIERGLVKGVSGVTAIRHEVAYGTSSRADLLVTTRRGKPWLVEIKSASMVDGRTSMFPDAVTERGLKHLNELLGVVKGGGRALLLFVATRDDVDSFRPAGHIDPVYAKRMLEVSQQGVVVRAVTSRVTRTAMTAMRAISVE
jgi:sugar fermentation stimulation protein A